MKESNYKSYDELPLFLNADMVSKVLGIAPSSAYELIHEKNFPVLKIGSRLVVPKEKFREWVEQNTGGNIWTINSIHRKTKKSIILLYQMKSSALDYHLEKYLFTVSFWGAKTEKHISAIPATAQSEKLWKWVRIL